MTFLGITRIGRVGLVAGFAVAGSALGRLLPWLVQRALDLPVVPFRGLLRLIDSAPDPWLWLGATALGLLAGTWLGVVAVLESLAVTLTDGQVQLQLQINRTTRSFDRSRIGSVFLDGKQLVLLDPDTTELAREKSDSSAQELAEAFRTHGYPWTDADPFLARYRLWVPELPGLPDGANALLAARARARQKKRTDEVVELRRELGRLRVAVRDDGPSQYWRRTDPR